MKLKRWAWLFLLLALPLLALACGDDGGGPPAREITVDDLALMALTAGEVDKALPGLAPVQQTFQGPVSNEDAIGRAMDPEEMRADIDKYGRIGGYETSYAPGEGEEEILITLELYETAEGASDFPRDPPGVPSTTIFLRVDRVFAGVSVSLSEEDVLEEVRQLAHRLEERIEAVIEGSALQPRPAP
jgi:hypothetical protein